MGIFDIMNPAANKLAAGRAEAACEAGEITYYIAVNYSHDPAEMRKKIHQQQKPSEQTQ